MQQAPIDELLKRCPSIYKLVVIAAKRAKELSEGAPKLVETDHKKVSSIALEEIRQGRVVLEGLEVEGEAKGGRTKAKRAKAKAAMASAGKKKKD